MRQRTMDEMITYFNQQVSEMDIDRKYKMALIGMITAIGYKASAQPERKTGKWIDNSEDGYVECPFCHSATNCDDNIDELHFCFSCGARLEVQDETD